MSSMLLKTPSLSKQNITIVETIFIATSITKSEPPKKLQSKQNHPFLGNSHISEWHLFPTTQLQDQKLWALEEGHVEMGEGLIRKGVGIRDCYEAKGCVCLHYCISTVPGT